MNVRAHREALLALEIPFGDRLDDPVVAWRRLFGEWLGTFPLVLTAAGGDVVDAVAPGGVPFAARVVAPGVIGELHGLADLRRRADRRCPARRRRRLGAARPADARRHPGGAG